MAGLLLQRQNQRRGLPQIVPRPLWRVLLGSACVSAGECCLARLVAATVYARVLCDRGRVLGLQWGSYDISAAAVWQLRNFERVGAKPLKETRLFDYGREIDCAARCSLCLCMFV